MAELAASAKEQATGLGEVNAAVNQTDQVNWRGSVLAVIDLAERLGFNVSRPCDTLKPEKAANTTMS